MNAEYTIKLTRPSPDPVSVAWATRDNTAKAGLDYTASAGAVTFAPGETRKTISVPILERTDTQLVRAFDVVLNSPINAEIADGEGSCQIVPASQAGSPGGSDTVAVPDSQRPFGPLIKHGLITNSYHNVLGRGGYFSAASGTSEGQAVAIEAAFLAHKALKDSNAQAAQWFRALGISMAEAMGDGSRVGPMLRQPFPSSPNTITLLHWLFAARGAIQSQGIRYDYQATVSNGKLVITDRAADVYRVWAIYPASSYLLYQNPYSPAYDTENPAGETQELVTDWQLINGRVEIPVPGKSGAWKIIYGYQNAGTIKQGQAQEAWPNWTLISDGYSACAPDTFRWFDLAINLLIDNEARAAKVSQWTNLRDAMRRTAVRGQAITDLREVFKPLAGLPVLPKSGEPSGVFCYSNHPAATPPPAGMDQGWIGYNFWSREGDGDILGTVPLAGATYQAQLGRGFNDEWREAKAYQDADQYLWVSLSCNSFLAGGKLYAFVSSTKPYNANTRWYADLTAMAGWAGVVASFGAGGVVDFFIPRTAFVRKDSDNAVLPAGTRLENFGISIDHPGGYQVRLRDLRLVAAATTAGKKGSKMPYFPGAMPFAINADTVAQQFVGWNGSPFHGYQLPDFWLYLTSHAEAVHPNLAAADLPVADPATGQLLYPIQPNVNGQAKPKAALLMEQQLLFLKHAQQKWTADSGHIGPFAHTFVLNTPARMSIGNPTPHTWVYTNDDPNTRWGGYQARVAESLAKAAWIGRYAPGFQTCRDMSAEMALDWLTWINTAWPNLNGVVVEGKTIYGPPTDFDDPRLKPVQTLYEEPHIAALIMRAAMWLKLYLPSSTALCDALMIRTWNYLERLWVTEGPMRYTWSPVPNQGEWFGFWHFEIIASLSTLLTEGARPDAIPAATIMERLEQTQTWLKDTGVK